jgi:maltose O-acetyltransferase
MASDVQQSGRGSRARVPLALIEAAMHRMPTFVGCRSITRGLRLAGVSIDSSSIFWGMPKLVGPGDVASRLTIGPLCGLNFGCYFELDAPITLVEHVAVGHEVMFLTRSRDPKDPSRRGAVSGAKPIVVGPGAWLGSRVVVMPGVTIGAGAVVGASVVVHEDVAPNTLLVGKRKISLAKWRG